MGGLAKRGNKRASVHLTFLKCVPVKGRKTDIYGVDGPSASLGEVRWHAPWRRYVFHPYPSTLYDPLCMESIATFCREKTEEHDARIKHQRKNGTKGKRG